MAIRLSVRPRGEAEATDLDFDQGRVRIGRAASCDVRLPDPSVSAVHAMVELDRDRYYVLDLGSTNGTALNGEPLVAERRRLLRSGDLLSIGSIEVRFQAGVAMLSPYTKERTVAAARRLARHVMEVGGLELRPPALVVLSGPQQGERFTVPPAPATLLIGRAEECDVVLVDGEVSRRHAELEVGPEGVTVRDLGGKNRLCVGDRQVVSRARLHDRDELLVGSTALVFDEPLEAFLREMAERPEVETTRTSLPPAEPSAASAVVEPPPRREEIASEADPEPAPVEGLGADWVEPEPAPEGGRERRAGSAGSEIAVLLVGALALAACVAALLWLFR